MLKLLARIIVIAVVLEGASLVFAEEMLLSTLILITIALTTASLVIGPENTRASRVLRRPQSVAISQKPIVNSASSLETSL